MKRKHVAKMVSAVLVTTMLMGLAGCGSSGTKDATQSGSSSSTGDEGIASDSPYAGKGYDLSEKKTVVMYVLGDTPEDMDEVLEKANSEYFEPNLNTTLDLEFLNWSDYSTKYSLLLAGGDPVDLIYTASWCYYNEEAANGAFKILDRDWLKQYMLLSYDQQPDESWDEISINNTIYAVPKSKATFTAYNQVAVRQDLIDKYNLTVPDSWDNYVKYLKELAQLKGMELCKNCKGELESDMAYCPKCGTKVEEEIHFDTEETEETAADEGADDSAMQTVEDTETVSEEEV